MVLVKLRIFWNKDSANKKLININSLFAQFVDISDWMPRLIFKCTVFS